MTTECQGNCKYGDHVWGSHCNPDKYDGSKCTCKQCPNFKLCKVWAPSWVFDCNAGRCINCNVSFRKNLVFREYTPPKECPVCLEDKLVHIKHPADCNHSRCMDCFRELWWPKSEINVDPRDWGFKPTCKCEDCAEPGAGCDDSMNAWERDYPLQYLAYLQEYDFQEEKQDAKRAEKGDPAICPLCKADVKNAHNNSW